MNIKCRLLGHDVSDEYTDGGHWICKHCNSHSYYHYDEDKWNSTPILLIPKRTYINIKRKINNYLTRNELPF